MKKIIAPLLLSALACAAQATTITVNNATDGSVPGACTLRDAVDAVNSQASVKGCVAGNGSNDTIEFSLPFGSEIVVASGHIEIKKDLIINAPAGGITLNANFSLGGSPSSNRIFYVTDGDSLNITGVRFINGSTGSDLRPGGAIFVDSLSNHTLTLESCAFQNNQSPHFSAGAVYTAGSTIIRNSTFSGNSATGFGGAVVAHTATISDSTFSNNSTANAGGAVVILSGGYAAISNSTFSSNSASSDSVGGGAVYATNGTTIIINNSTFSNNRATGTNSGGGAVRTSGSTTITTNISNSTFEGNSATSQGGAVHAYALNARHLTLLNNTTTNPGGGQALYINHSSGSATLHNSIIIGNSNSAQCTGVTFTGSHNLEGWAASATDVWNNASPATCGTTTPVTVSGTPTLSDIIATTLADNGGPTKTLALSAASPAIGAADPAGGTSQMWDFNTSAWADATEDQRGSARKDVVSGRDVGAYERNGLTITGNMPNGTEGVAYAGGNISASGAASFTYAVTSGALPPGLSLDASSGTVSGTPMQAGVYSFAITASDASGNLTGMGFEVTIAPRAASSGTPIPALPAPLLVLTGLLTALAGMRLRRKAGLPQG